MNTDTLQGLRTALTLLGDGPGRDALASTIAEIEKDIDNEALAQKLLTSRYSSLKLEEQDDKGAYIMMAQIAREHFAKGAQEA